jgi:hypothetical protein
MPTTRHGGAWGEEEVYLLLIIDLGTRWGEWLVSRPGRALAPGNGPPGTPRRKETTRKNKA